MRRLLLFFSLAILLAGCGGDTPRIDGTSDAAFEASVEHVTEQIGDERRRLEFQSALVALSLDQLGAEISTARAGGETKGEAGRQAEYRTALDGLTADEVIEKAKPAMDRLMKMKDGVAPAAP